MLNLLDMIELEDEPDASDGAVLNGEAVESEQEAGATVY